MSNNSHQSEFNTFLQKHHAEVIRILFKNANNGNSKSESKSYNMHSDAYYNGYCNSNTSSNVSYSSNNNIGYSSMNVTFTSLIG
jgi:hypothetical protein